MHNFVETEVNNLTWKVILKKMVNKSFAWIRIQEILWSHQICGALSWVETALDWKLLWILCSRFFYLFYLKFWSHVNCFGRQWRATCFSIYCGGHLLNEFTRFSQPICLVILPDFNLIWGSLLWSLSSALFTDLKRCKPGCSALWSLRKKTTETAAQQLQHNKYLSSPDMFQGSCPALWSLNHLMPPPRLLWPHIQNKQ